MILGISSLSWEIKYSNSAKSKELEWSRSYSFNIFTASSAAYYFSISLLSITISLAKSNSKPFVNSYWLISESWLRSYVLNKSKEAVDDNKSS